MTGCDEDNSGLETKARDEQSAMAAANIAWRVTDDMAWIAGAVEGLSA